MEFAAIHCSSAPNVSTQTGERCGAAAPWAVRTAGGERATLCTNHLEFWQRRGAVSTFEPIKTSTSKFAVRFCETCGGQYGPVRMAQRFCESECRVQWWREHQIHLPHSCRCGKLCNPLVKEHNG